MHAFSLFLRLLRVLNITLHYIILHHISLHYVTLRYITLHYITLHYHGILQLALYIIIYMYMPLWYHQQH